MRLALAALALAAGCSTIFGLESPTRNESDMPGDAGTDASPDAASQTEIGNALLRQWSGCMSLANFQAANMKAWGTVPAPAQTTGTQQTCETCHGTGDYGFIATSTNDSLFFDVISSNRYYMQHYFAVDLLQQQINVNFATLIPVSMAQAPHTTHPTFDRFNAGTDALMSFYASTLSRLQMGTCDAPRLVN